MTVWIFGASYATNYNYPSQWMNLVASSLDTDAKAYAINGSSLDYTYNKFNQERNNIKDGDIVIVTLTSHIKRWFFKYYPHHTVVPHPDCSVTTYKYLMTSPTGNPKENKALDFYQEYLNNDEVYELYTINFLHNLHYLTKKKNLHTIIMTSYYETDTWLKDKKNMFPYLKFSTGLLIDITILEYSKEALIDMVGVISDKRVNHITKRNHKILAEKIIDNIKFNTNIDLSKGFHKHFIKNNDLSNEGFINSECFGGTI